MSSLRSIVSALSVVFVVMNGSAASAAPCGSSTKGYEAAMKTMHANMHAPLSGDADVDFVRQMVPHHQGAVDMANVELKYGHDEKLKAFARWIIRAQEKEIAFMNNWLERHDNGAHPANATDYYGAAMMTMHRNMMIDYTGDADRDFVRGMIPHHQGAVDMAAIWFTHGKNPELTRLTNDIYSSQTYEIAKMQKWLSEHPSTH